MPAKLIDTHTTNRAQIAQDPRSDRHHTQSRNSSHAEEQDSYVTPDTNTPGSAPSGSELRDLRPKEYDDGVVQTVVSSSKDALGLLFQAAEEEDTDDSEDPIVTSGAPDHTSPTSTMAHHPGITPSRLSRPSREVVDLWEEFSFVRQGWFSATEAVTYIDLSVVATHFHTSLLTAQVFPQPVQPDPFA